MKSIFLIILFFINQISLAEVSQNKTLSDSGSQAILAIKVYPTYSEYLNFLMKVGIVSDLDVAEIIQFLKMNKTNQNDLILLPLIKQDRLQFGDLSIQQSTSGNFSLASGKLIYFKKNQNFAQNFKNNFALLSGRTVETSRVFSFFIEKAQAETAASSYAASAALMTTTQTALNVAMSGATCTLIGGGVLALGAVWDLIMGYQYIDGKITKGHKVFCRDGHFQEYVADYQFFLSGLPEKALKAFEAAQIELQNSKDNLSSMKSIELAVTCAKTGSKLISLHLNPETLPKPRLEYKNVSNQILEKTFGTKRIPVCDGSPEQLKAVQNTRQQLALAETQAREDSLGQILKNTSKPAESSQMNQPTKPKR